MVEKIKHLIVPRENCQEERPPGDPVIYFPGAPLGTQSGSDVRNQGTHNILKGECN